MTPDEHAELDARLERIERRYESGQAAQAMVDFPVPAWVVVILLSLAFTAARSF